MHEFHSTYTRLLFCTFPSHWQFFLMLKKEITFLNYIYILKQVVLKSLLNREIVQTILLYQNNSIYIFSSQVFDLWLKNLLSRELTLKKKKQLHLYGCSETIICHQCVTRKMVKKKQGKSYSNGLFTFIVFHFSSSCVSVLSAPAGKRKALFFLTKVNSLNNAACIV